jgi:RimJ/RimL family protein N-acetyltransferase
MQHDICAVGHAFRLRPIELGDASLIIELRANQPDRTRYVHKISSDVEVQRKYLIEYFSRSHDYYFVLERLKNNKAEGLIAIYDLDPDMKMAEWGRWVLHNKSLGAVESCWLIYQIAFSQLGLDRIYCRTVTCNESVVSFHNACGLEINDFLKNHFELDGRSYDAIEHSLLRDRWMDIDQNLNKQSRQIAARLNR